MSEQKKDEGGSNPGGDGKPEGGTPTPDKETPGGSPDNSLESASAEDLRKMIGDLRKEAADHRTKAQQAKDRLDQVSGDLKKLKDEKKSDTEKEAERVAGLESEAARVPVLAKYADYVASELAEEMKYVNGLKAEQKRPFNDLLGTFSEDDHLGRLKAVRALKAAAGAQAPVKSGDEGSPGEPGGGENKTTLAKQLAWSPAGLLEAQLAGLVPAQK